MILKDRNLSITLYSLIYVGVSITGTGGPKYFGNVAFKARVGFSRNPFNIDLHNLKNQY
jgi:hypothetical protein